MFVFVTINFIGGILVHDEANNLVTIVGCSLEIKYRTIVIDARTDVNLAHSCWHYDVHHVCLWLEYGIQIIHLVHLHSDGRLGGETFQLVFVYRCGGWSKPSALHAFAFVHRGVGSDFVRQHAPVTELIAFGRLCREVKRLAVAHVARRVARAALNGATINRPGRYIIMYQSVLEEHPLDLSSIVAPEVLLIHDTIALHLQYVVTIGGQAACIQAEDAIVLHHGDGQINGLFYTLVAQDDVFTCESLCLDGLVEGDSQFVDGCLGNVVFIGYGLNACDIEAHIGRRFELNYIAECLGTIGIIYNVQLVFAQGVKAVLHSPLRRPEVLWVDIFTSGLVLDR